MTVAIDSPYNDSPDAVWLRGNLHAHSTRSDGVRHPQAVIDQYAARGYDFLAISDHDVFSDYTGLDPKGMALIPACEFSQGTHMLLLGLEAPIRFPSLDRQAVINEVTRRGGMVVLCHPKWGEHNNHFPYETMAGLKDYMGIEIFNGGVVTSAGCAVSTDRWDRLLSARKHCWGIAADDSHRPAEDGRGWCVVKARERTPEAILDALRLGSFYASSGVTVDSITVRDHILRSVSRDAQAIAVVSESGQRIAFVEDSELLLDASGLDKASASVTSPFFRIEYFGRGGRMAWSQPFLVRGERIEKRRRMLAARPTCRAARSGQPVAISASMSDEIWKSARPISAFVMLGTAEAPAMATEVRCVVDPEKLLLGIECEEPLLDEMKLNCRGDGLRGLWTDDSVEIFIDVEGEARRYYQIMVNAAGFASGSEVRYPPDTDTQCKTLRTQTDTARDAHGWRLVIAVPLDDLDAPTNPGQRWGFNVARNRHPKPSGNYIWSFTGQTNHRPDCFGWLEFG